MNPFFAALAAVAFGLTVVGADVSAAPQPSHPAPARKAAPAAKAAAKPVSKPVSKPAAKAAPKAAPARAAAPAKAPAPKAVVIKGGATKSIPAKPAPAKAAAAIGKQSAGKMAATGKAGRGAKAVVQAAPVEVVTRGRKGRAEPVVAAVREPRAQRRGRGEPPAPAPVVERQPVVRGGAAPIGREAFVPSSPPISRAEAVRQLQGRVAAPAAAPVAPRAALTIPPPAVEVSRAASRSAAAAEAPLQATSELQRPVAPVARYTPATSELSGPEAAAAAAAALNTSRAAEAARPAAPPPAAPAPVERTVVPASPAVVPAQPAAAPVAVPAQPQSRPGRGVARAYAMDGATFYQSGRKIRVQGLDAREPGMSSEHATQRLQRALDAGSVSVEPVEVDGSGHTVAVVRVNGRNVADAVRASTN
ncbi:hypothetical protein [Zoogloea sp.]|uniref:hypothetical protein n=1 Tax=Zoogloea sp. TaxID=49181 RepID=UPI0025E54416|nr:hypothetical protein [Zoogloea sp.]MCK6392976.1 hypothetical protein [Zoogloea sp.]